jgi:hypothetical protein
LPPGEGPDESDAVFTFVQNRMQRKTAFTFESPGRGRFSPQDICLAIIGA